MAEQLIDTHIHIWNFDKADYLWLKGNTSILNRTYNIEELEKERQSAGVTGGILVQATNNLEDTDWMLQVAADKEWVKGVVGWLPLMETGKTEEALKNKYSKSIYFKGVRHLIHDEPDAGWLLQPQVIDSLKILRVNNIPYDIVGILPEHIETALQVADKIPGLKMVFDHMNQPPIAAKERFGRWGELMKEASDYPNFYIKISGLGTTSQTSGWNADDVLPYIEFIFEWFGIDRSFCGGDWPVSLLAGSYTYTWSIYKEVFEKLLNSSQLNKVMHENASSFYNL